MPFSMIEFTCSTSACVGKSDRAKAAFKELQKQLNRHGAGLVEDGAIGTNTLNAARKVLRNQAIAREGLATLADTYATQVSKLPTPEFPIVLPSPNVPASPIVEAPPLDPLPEASNGWGWALLAGLGLLAGVGALIYSASR